MSFVNGNITQVPYFGALTYLQEQTDVQLGYPDEHAKRKLKCDISANRVSGAQSKSLENTPSTALQGDPGIQMEGLTVSRKISDSL